MKIIRHIYIYIKPFCEPSQQPSNDTCFFFNYMNMIRV